MTVEHPSRKARATARATCKRAATSPMGARDCPTAREPRLRSADDVAAYLAVAVLSVYRLLRTGRLRGHKVGGQWRISDDAVSQFLEEEINVPRKRKSRK